MAFGEEVGTGKPAAPTLPEPFGLKAMAFLPTLYTSEAAFASYPASPRIQTDMPGNLDARQNIGLTFGHS
jgi:hypothetical protein